MENIHINLCKVHHLNNNVYVYLDADCNGNNGYKFTKCSITVTKYDPSTRKWSTSTTSLDYSSAIEGLTSKTKIQHALPITSLIGGNPYAIYTVNLSAENSESPELPELTKSALISDVLFVYKCLIDRLTNQTNDNCDIVSDDLIKIYLCLYGHTTAMQYNDLPTAKEFYHRLVSSCGRCSSLTPSCNCSCC